MESKDKENEWNTVHTRSGRIMKPPILYMNEHNSEEVEGMSSTIHQNYYA